MTLVVVFGRMRVGNQCWQHCSWFGFSSSCADTIRRWRKKELLLTFGMSRAKHSLLTYRRSLGSLTEVSYLTVLCRSPSSGYELSIVSILHLCSRTPSPFGKGLCRGPGICHGRSSCCVFIPAAGRDRFVLSSVFQYSRCAALFSSSVLILSTV
jgi:hypothetical protein